MEIRQIRALWLWAALGAMLAGCWQSATVAANFGGNWTALFCTGDRTPVPPRLAQGTYIFGSSPGYDGQWYRYMAHDPLARAEMPSYIDAPPLRYRRILVPALAWLLALGRPGAVDAAYIAVVLGWVFAGCYWCGIWAVRQEKHPASGLLFLAIPATLISLDRMTVDVALAALAAGAAVYWQAKRLPACYLCIAAGCLARETGVLIAGGWVIGLLLQKRWSAAAVFSTSVLPAGAWFLYLRAVLPRAAREQSVPKWLFHWDSGILGRMLDPVSYGFAEPLESLVRAVDVLALGGMVIALIVAGAQVFRRPANTPAIAAALHVGLFAILNLKGFWETVYGYARPFSPMLVLSAIGTPWRSALGIALLLAIAAIDSRIILQMAPQALGILKYWLQ